MPEAPALANWLGQSASTFGLAEAAVPDDEALHRARGRGVTVDDWRKVGMALEEAETYLPDHHEAPIDRWLAAITETLGLDQLETEILALALHYRLDQRVDRLFDLLSECRGGQSRFHRDAALIGLLLNAPTADVDSRLMPEARLQASGSAASPARRGTGGAGAADGADPAEHAAGSGHLQPVARHDDDEAAALGCFRASWARGGTGRRQSCERRSHGLESGVNILLYGPPGTGKTSFAATLAARVGARLRPVAEADEGGDEPQRHERLAGLRLAQRLAASQNTMLLFDEAEDLFVSRSTIFDEPVLSSRVFIHRLLERMAVPVIWTANDIEALGPAVLRRMTMCLELKVPNLVTRTRLWRQMGEAEGVVLREADATRLARLVPAAPAVASSALRAARLAGGGAEAARLIVEGVARAVHGGALPAPEREHHDTLYDPALVNADCDLAALLDRLARPGADRAVSCLLSGPPGSGKSAWVRHLADRMGLQVLQKRASDLLDAFVGGTERNIADAFAEARDANAFLVFDEADRLLDRADAVRSWEISQVNEMLTWMEQHALPFACTTNLLDRLDRASLRRFLVKVRFDWLTPAQARLAFQRFFSLTAPDGLDGLRTLTPADFSLVRRRAALQSGETNPAMLLSLLVVECEGRGGRGPMGFIVRAPK